MGKVTVPSSGGRPSSLPDAGQDPGAEGASLFGISLARVLRIPVQRWQLTLLVVAVSAAVAYFYAKRYTQSYYESVGTLIHRAPPEHKDIPASKNLETHIEEMRNQHYFRQLNEKFGLNIPPEHFAQIFDIRKPLDSSVIQVRLKWEDSTEGPKLINALMELHRNESEEYRRKDLGRALKGTVDALRESEKQLKEATRRRDEVLRGKSVRGNPKDKLAEVSRDVERLEAQVETARAEHTRLKADVKKCLAEIDLLRKKQKAGTLEPDDEDTDEAFKQQKRQLELDLIACRQELAEKERLLKGKEEEYRVKKPLADRGVITAPVIEELERTIKDTRGAVEAVKKKMEIRTREKNDLRPGSAQLRRLLGERSALQLKEASAQREIERTEILCAGQRKLARQLEEVEKEWAPLDGEVKLLQKEREDLRVKQGELDLRLRNVAGELEVGSPATPSLIAMGDFKKRVLMGFFAPLLLGFGLMVVREMTTSAWRAETLAEKLRLPVLAEAPLARGRPGQAAELPPDSCRGLSLRLRQFVPDNGAVILVSSLNDGPAVDQLAAGVSRYLGMRNERVLILDARIAQAEAVGLSELIERRADERATAALGRVGLVQSLVFAGHGWSEFVCPTRMPGVDYLPAGGPYPVTDALASEPMDDLLKALRERYSILLLVGPALSLGVDTEILAASADGMVVLLSEPLNSFSVEVEELVRSLEEAKPGLLLGSVVCI